MGRGIDAAIPLSFEPCKRWGLDEKRFTKGFFNNYIIEELDGAKVYTIKKDLLINNYKSFLIEFYSLIEEDFQEETNIPLDNIPEVNTYDEFLTVFSGNSRNNRTPFIYESPLAFSTTGGCECSPYFLFYNGSSKAYLETYSTLFHFETILSKAMESPLSNAVKFGIFG